MGCARMQRAYVHARTAFSFSPVSLCFSVRGFVGEHEVLDSRSVCRAEVVDEGGRGKEDH